ncbi:MAG: hypothetical protein NVS4B2_14700 [Chloroflexota bacterium]
MPRVPVSCLSPSPSRLNAACDALQFTSDCLFWRAEADRALGLCTALAAHIPEWRRRRGRHPLAILVRQRVFQIACSYEDQNDATTLRSNLLLKLVCGRLPDDADLASQRKHWRKGSTGGLWSPAEMTQTSPEHGGSSALSVMS